MNIRRLLGIAAALTLSGCAATGNGSAPRQSGVELERTVVVGRSTKSDMERLFGAPKVYRFDSGQEVWVYLDRQAIPTFVRHLPIVGPISNFVPENSHELVLLFGANGVLKKYRLGEPTP
jgi:hypothetical protein